MYNDNQSVIKLMQYGGGELFLPLGATCHQRDRDAPRSGRVVLSTLHEDENAAGGGGIVITLSVCLPSVCLVFQEKN